MTITSLRQARPYVVSPVCGMRKSKSSLVRYLLPVVNKFYERDTHPTRQGGPAMLMRTDPFRELDRLTQQVFGTTARPAAMPMDAYRQGDEFFVHFDLPGIDP